MVQPDLQQNKTIRKVISKLTDKSNFVTVVEITMEIWVPVSHWSPVYPFLQLQLYGRPLEGTEEQVPYKPHGFPLHRAVIIVNELHLKPELPGIPISSVYQN